MRFLFATTLALFSNLAPAADWPQFLGPQRSGVADTKEAALPDTFPGDLKPIWEKSAGSGFAGPVVVGGKVILFHREGSDMTTEALDADSPALRVANATPYLQAFGHVIVAWLWLDLACTGAQGAKEILGPLESGHLQACRYFFGYELPRVAAWLQAVSRRDTTCLDMRDEWF